MEEFRIVKKGDRPKWTNGPPPPPLDSHTIFMHNIPELLCTQKKNSFNETPNIAYDARVDSLA